MIWPSILILIGACEVKNRSEAFFSTISLNSGRVLSTKLRAVPAPVVESLRIRSVGGLVLSTSVAAMAGLLLFLEDLECAALLEVGLVGPLALELDAQPDL